jgi:hypothetical protein
MSFPDEVPLRELEDLLSTLAAHLSAGMCRWLELVGEFDRRRGWFGWGVASCAEWLAWRCALQPRAAREHVRVARLLPELPLIHAAFARGELSYAKVRALVRVAEPETEHNLLDLAEVLTASQLERALRACRRVLNAEAQEVHEDAHLDLFWDEDDALVVQGRLAPEDGALLVRAIEAARDTLAEEGECGSAEPRRRRATRAQALVALADATLAAAETRTGGDRCQVVVHVDADTFTGNDESAGGCVVEDGPAIAVETARRLACDASVVAVSERRGRSVQVGRKTRTVPIGLRRALKKRDECCRFPGCDNRRFLQAHHVRHWAKGGKTDLDNLMLLCTAHHRSVHEGECSVDNESRFFDARGRPLPEVWKPTRGDPSALKRPDLAIGPDTCARGLGERMELKYVADIFLDILGRPRPAWDTS